MKTGYESTRERRGLRQELRAYFAIAKILAVTLIILIGFATINRLDTIMTEQDNLHYQIIVIQQDIEEVKESIDNAGKVAVRRQNNANTTSIGEYTITHYCPCKSCCGKTDGITATGTVATADRTIAVDPSVIPYGTEVIIDGKTYVAEDCGGAIKGRKIDIYVDSHQEAINRGRVTREVFLR